MSDNKQLAAALSAPFNAEDLKQRPGRGGLVFTYADARAVAQRLDDVLGVEGWQFEVAVADVARSVVKGSLAVVLGGKTVVREDFGYPNSAQDDEPLKSAASDALRRCAAQLGVAGASTGAVQRRRVSRHHPRRFRPSPWLLGRSQRLLDAWSRWTPRWHWRLRSSSRAGNAPTTASSGR